MTAVLQHTFQSMLLNRAERQLASQYFTSKNNFKNDYTLTSSLTVL